jgi:hypothetical protein
MASDLGDSTADALERVKDTVAGTAEQLQQTGATAAQTARSRLDEGVRDMQSLVGEAGEAAISRTQEMKGMISGMAGSAGSAASETASRVGETIRDAQSRTAQAGREFFDSTRERLSEAGEKTAETLREQVRNNPIMVAGIGLLIGGLLASVLPKSETEASLMGPASDRMRRKARQAAAAGFDAAKGASGEILANVAQQASAEGLTPDGLAQSAQDVGQRLQRVAERAVTTAFDPDQQSEHKHQNESTESTGGGKQHG